MRRGVDLVGDDRRPLGLAQRHRLEHGDARFDADRHDVVEHVDQVDAPGRFGVELAGGEEVLLAQRIGCRNSRPGIVDQLVADDRLDLLAVAGDPLHDAVGLVLAQGGVEDDQFAHPRHAVVAGDDAHELRRVIRESAGRRRSSSASSELLPYRAIWLVPSGFIRITTRVK